jgi:hypothetical protein
MQKKMNLPDRAQFPSSKKCAAAHQPTSSTSAGLEQISGWCSPVLKGRGW